MNKLMGDFSGNDGMKNCEKMSAAGRRGGIRKSEI